MTGMRGAAFAPIELKEDDADPAEVVTKALADLRASVDERLKTVETKSADATKLDDRLDKIEAKLNRPKAANDNGKTPENDIESKAFTGFLRSGREALPVDEVKALRIADDTAGGYVAPPQFVAEVDKNLVEFSPIRLAARVGNTSERLRHPSEAHRYADRAWVVKPKIAPKPSPAYGQAEIPVHEAACYVDVSKRLLEDAAVNVDAEVAFDLAEEFGRLEGVAFVNGDGVKKPSGFMTDAAITQTLNGHATILRPTRS